MHSPQPEDKFDVPTGSERVVNIRRLPHTSTTPLTVNTQMMMSPDIETMHERKRHHRKHRHEHHVKSHGHHGSLRKSSKNRSRSSKAWATELPSDNASPRKVLSCLEMTIGGSVGSIPVNSDVEHNTPHSPAKLSKSHKKTRSNELGSWLSLKPERTDHHYKWRHSNIFAPESPKTHSRKHRTHKSRHSTIDLSPNPQALNTPVSVPLSHYPSLPVLACPKCGTDVPSRAYSHEVLGSQSYYPNPYLPPQSPENINAPHKFPGSWNPHHYHHHHPRMYVPRSRTMPPPVGFEMPSQTTFLSTSADDLGFIENEAYERMLMEIEYAALDEDDMTYKMTPKTLRFIVNLAKQVCKIDDLEEMAKQIKLTLDKQYGEKWQVVIGDDSFGSYLASLPGGLANFRINDFVFLIWQT